MEIVELNRRDSRPLQVIELPFKSAARPRVAIAGGFTGGHLFPGLAVAEEIKRRWPQAHVLFFGTRGGLEETVLPGHPYPYVFLPCLRAPQERGWRRLLKTPAWGGRMLRAAAQAKRALVSNRIEVVIGTGGHASAAPLFAARRLGLPALLLEQNAIPGRTNLFLSRWAVEVHTQFPESIARFPQPEKICLSGNPVRRDVLRAGLGARKSEITANSAQTTSETGLRAVRNRQAAPPIAPMKKGKDTTLLILGGSQGARGVNQAVCAALPRLIGELKDLRLLHITGHADIEACRHAHAAAGSSAKVMAFTEDMGAQYAKSDMVLCRAGATTIAELTALGLPAVLVPYPYAADDHQSANAQSLADAGAALSLPESSLMDTLAPALLDLLKDHDRRSAMRKAMISLAKPRAAAEIAARAVHYAGCRAGADRAAHRLAG
jgi:UDP-N-acetylglucosamine--N-acetylmuramyl-(pentapeptide) pyrophosphoryl-undecaprenol N-acetylglucosamine transferase